MSGRRNEAQNYSENLPSKSHVRDWLSFVCRWEGKSVGFSEFSVTSTLWQSFENINKYVLKSNYQKKCIHSMQIRSLLCFAQLAFYLH